MGNRCATESHMVSYYPRFWNHVLGQKIPKKTTIADKFLRIFKRNEREGPVFSKDMLEAAQYGSFSEIGYLLGNFLSKNPYDHKKVLSIGCGYGEDLNRISKIIPGCEICGIDISFDVLKEAGNRTKNADFICASISNLPLRSDVEFDGVIISHLLELYQQNELEIILDGIKNIMSSCSRLYITAHGFYSYEDDQEELCPLEQFKLGDSLLKNGSWKCVHEEFYLLRSRGSPYARGAFWVGESAF